MENTKEKENTEDVVVNEGGANKLGGNVTSPIEILSDDGEKDEEIEEDVNNSEDATEAGEGKAADDEKSSEDTKKEIEESPEDYRSQPAFVCCCGESFRFLGQITSHKKKSCDWIYICQHCDRVYKDFDKMVAHRAHHIPPPQDGKNNQVVDTVKTPDAAQKTEADKDKTSESAVKPNNKTPTTSKKESVTEAISKFVEKINKSKPIINQTRMNPMANQPKGVFGANQPRFGPMGGNFGMGNFGPMGGNYGQNMGPNMGPNFGPMGGNFGPNYGPNMGGNFGPNMGGNFWPNMGGNFGPNMGGNFGPMGGNFGPNMGGNFGPNMGGNFGPNMAGNFGPNMGGNFPNNMAAGNFGGNIPAVAGGFISPGSSAENKLSKLSNVNSSNLKEVSMVRESRRSRSPPSRRSSPVSWRRSISPPRRAPSPPTIGSSRRRDDLYDRDRKSAYESVSKSKSSGWPSEERSRPWSSDLRDKKDSGRISPWSKSIGHNEYSSSRSSSRMLEGNSNSFFSFMRDEGPAGDDIGRSSFFSSKRSNSDHSPHRPIKSMRT